MEYLKCCARLSWKFHVKNWSQQGLDLTSALVNKNSLSQAEAEKLNQFQAFPPFLYPIWEHQNTRGFLPSNIYLLKVNSRNTRFRCKICSKLTIKTPERGQWCSSGVFIVNFEHISHLFLAFLLLTFDK